MNAAAEVFESHRPRLLGVACRMLGSRTDAEDLVQDAYLRWHHCPKDDIQSPVAWLVTTTTRLCLDRLRDLKHERLDGAGSWPSTTASEDTEQSPEDRRELAEEVAAAFGTLLERLGPGERVAFLLHDVFDRDYPEIARMLGKAEPACRQIIRRARARLKEPAPRFAVPPGSRERMLENFLAALASGDGRDVVALLAGENETADGQGRKPRRALKGLEAPVASVDLDAEADIDDTWDLPLPRWPESAATGAMCHNTPSRAVL